MRLEDMRLFAKVAEASGFTAAARLLGLPKQTVSRRIAGLEEALGVRLLHRTTRRLRLTGVGAAYAERCAEIVRLADEANRAVTSAQEEPRGTLRVTADPVFGEAFLGDLVVEYARKWTEVRVDVLLTRRKVDLIEEGFDVAFRIGGASDPALTATSLGPARVRYCASAGYLSRRGVPATPADLKFHDCLVLETEGAPVRWPFRGGEMVKVSGRLRLGSFALAHAAARAGLGIGIFPEFTCAADIRRKRLVPLLDEFVADVGGVWVVHPTRRSLSAPVRAFVDLARERFASNPPWMVKAERRQPGFRSGR